MKLVTTEFKSGGLHEKQSWEPSQNLLIDTRKPRKTCVEMAGRRTFRVLTSSADVHHLALYYTKNKTCTNLASFTGLYRDTRPTEH